MDIIFITGLKVPATIGVFDWEKSIKQELVFDLEIAWDVRKAAASDDLNDTVDYAAVAETISAFVDEHCFELIETLAEHVAALLQKKFAIKWLSLTLHKPGAVPAASSVGVKITRGSK